MKEKNSLRLEIDSLASELSSRYEELNLIYRVSDKLTVAEDLLGTTRDIIQEASNILFCNTVMLSVPESGIFEHVSNNSKYSKDDLLRIITHIDAQCRSRECQIVVNSIEDYKRLGFTDSDWFKLIATSVKVRDEHKGILIAICENKERDHTTGDLKLLSVLAGQLSVIITNSELYQSLKEFLLNLVKSMVSAIEAKDSYTRGHSERVNTISVMIAREMEFAEKDIENTSWAAILHDIGKIGIPEKILTKPEGLTDEEYAVVKTHPEKGYEILKPIIQLKDALQGILYHQERYDGNGYPEGLKGEEIPVVARIIAVADIYDAITSSRAYRKRNSHMNAMKEIERVSGTQLDPFIVEIFSKICDGNPDFIRGEQKKDEDKQN